MNKKQAKSRVQELSKDIDKLIEETLNDLPKGCTLSFMNKGQLLGWRGISGKYLDIGMVTPLP